MANRRFNQFNYSFHRKPVVLNALFTVAQANANGLGVTPLTAAQSATFGGPNPSTTSPFGGGIAAVLMNASSPATGNNVAAGNLYVQFQDNYLNLFDYTCNFSSVVTGSAVNLTTGLTAGTMYQIVTVGTSTQANWQAVGLPLGITPAVGVPFIASTATAGTGTGTVKALASAQHTTVELGGNPQLTLYPAPSQVASGFNGGAGGYLLFNIYKTTTLQQPTDGAVCNMRFLLQGN